MNSRVINGIFSKDFYRATKKMMEIANMVGYSEMRVGKNEASVLLNNGEYWKCFKTSTFNCRGYRFGKVLLDCSYLYPYEFLYEILTSYILSGSVKDITYF